MSSEQRKFTIGRNSACDLSLADDTVSDRHAEIAFIGDGKILLTDTNSSNGTFVIKRNNQAQKIRQELISPLDSVRFGSVTLGVKELLEALRMKFPRFEESLNGPPPRNQRPWAEGRRLIRCQCGAVIRPEQKNCPECGR